MIIHDFPQRSEEWHKIRLGRLTASEAQTIATNGKGLETLCWDLASEKISGFSSTPMYTNEDMERGVKLEEDARNLYEISNEISVKEVGFISEGDYIGCSPDGLVGEDGGIEIKCPNDKNFLYVVLKDYIDPKYMAQIQMTLFLTGRKWWDYVAYNPHFKNSLYVRRITPDAEIIKKIQQGLICGEEQIKKLISEWEEKCI